MNKRITSAVVSAAIFVAISFRSWYSDYYIPGKGGFSLKGLMVTRLIRALHNRSVILVWMMIKAYSSQFPAQGTSGQPPVLPYRGRSMRNSPTPKILDAICNWISSIHWLFVLASLNLQLYRLQSAPHLLSDDFELPQNGTAGILESAWTLLKCLRLSDRCA